MSKIMLATSVKYGYPNSSLSNYKMNLNLSNKQAIDEPLWAIKL